MLVSRYRQANMQGLSAQRSPSLRQYPLYKLLFDKKKKARKEAPPLATVGAS